ncbi:MAG: hypothetical protein GXP63_04160 [DPANN group archaeon]|nr:hypothetical protein [DPANN group archaeon]
MKAIVFDTGPIISITLNNLLYVLRSLRKRYQGRFLITPAIKRELIDRPLKIKRFEFEALQVMTMIEDHTLEIVDNSKVKRKADRLMRLANSIYKAKGKYIQIVQQGEMEGLALVLLVKAEGFIVDERTTRYLLESPERVHSLMEHRLHTPVEVNREQLALFKKEVGKFLVLRSAELVTVAFELGFTDQYLPKMPNGRTTLLDGLLWGMKLKGAAVSATEIENLKLLALQPRKR